MHDANCIFCRILAGTVPCARVYEDGHALAFLDIAPFEEGHTLVIPKRHAERLVDLSADDLRDLMPAVQWVARALLERLPCDGFNVLQSNGRCASQVVPHVHFHVIPRWNGRPLRWTGQPYAVPETMAGLAARLAGSRPAD